jgi:hypothetical protein
MFGAIEDKHNLRSSCTSNLFLYLVFIAVISEKPASYKYAVVNGNITAVAAPDSVGYWLEICSQKSDGLTS